MKNLNFVRFTQLLAKWIITERPIDRKYEGDVRTRTGNTNREDKDVKQERRDRTHRHRTPKTSGKVKNNKIPLIPSHQRAINLFIQKMNILLSKFQFWIKISFTGCRDPFSLSSCALVILIRSPIWHYEYKHFKIHSYVNL